MISVTPITRLKVRILTIGLHPDERLVEIIQADGIATECFVWIQSLNGEGLAVKPMEGRADGAILVELPQKTVAGHQRVWVPADGLFDEVIEPPIITALANTRSLSAEARVATASQAAFELAIDALHDMALQRALFARNDKNYC